MKRFLEALEIAFEAVGTGLLLALNAVIVVGGLSIAVFFGSAISHSFSRSGMQASSVLPLVGTAAGFFMVLAPTAALVFFIYGVARMISERRERNG
jgi:hypothetical protein